MNILIADDEIEMIELLKSSLSRKGHIVDTASSGDKALDLIKSNRYELVFLDHNMPELTGIELIKYIKENSLKAKTVMITGYPSISDFGAKAVGADEYLVKPIMIEKIEEIIEKYSQGRKHV